VIDGPAVVARDGRVEGHGFDTLSAAPLDPLAVALARYDATAAADPHLVANVLALDFPEVAKPEPGVGALDLLAVGADDLLEQAVVVTDAVAEARQVQRRHGVEEAGREAPQAAVAEAGVLLLLREALQAHADLLEQGAGAGIDVQVDRGIEQG